MEYRRIANITEGHRFLNLSVLDADGLEHSFHWPNELAPDIRDWPAVVDWVLRHDVEEPLHRLLTAVDDHDINRWHDLKTLTEYPVEYFAADMTDEERERMLRALKEVL